MLKRTATAILLSTTLLAGAAVAQTATPAATIPTGSGQFVTDQSATHFRASKFVGLDVYGSEGQKVGDINEILIDGSGNAQAVVIGVGGFLGIGEKNVAVPFSALEWVNARPAAQTASNATTPAGTPVGSSVTGVATTTPRADVTGSTTAAPERSPAEQAAYNGYPDHAVLKLTKADLQNAPQFKYYSDTHSRSAVPSNAPAAPMTTAPRQ